jgi:hypothetical protein
MNEKIIFWLTLEAPAGGQYWAVVIEETAYKAKRRACTMDNHRRDWMEAQASPQARVGMCRTSVVLAMDGCNANIENMTRDECKVTHDRVQARLKQLRTEDPMVYAIKWLIDGQTPRYHTRCPGKGDRQFFARDLTHSHLWVCTSRANAEFMIECFRESFSSKKVSWEVVEIPKTELAELPCYKTNYSKNEEMRA